MNAQYLQYNPIEFATDDTFISWVKQGNNDTAWRKWIDRNPSMIPSINEARELILQIKFVKNPVPQNAKFDVWNRIEQNKNKDIPIKKIGRRRLKTSLAIAASLAFVVFGTWFMFSNTTTINTAIAEHKEITLPEKSIVHLNANSTISYNENDFLSNRKIQLNGEAYFEVEKGEPFIVTTNLGNIAVLGTSFNVFKRDNELIVKCFSGSVEVSTNDIIRVLQPNEGVSFRSGSSSFVDISWKQANRAAWIDGYYYFDDAPLSKVFDAFNRQFNANLSVADDGILERRYTGFFSNNNIEEALYSVCWPMNLKFELQQKNQWEIFSEE